MSNDQEHHVLEINITENSAKIHQSFNICFRWFYYHLNSYRNRYATYLDHEIIGKIIGAIGTDYWKKSDLLNFVEVLFGNFFDSINDFLEFGIGINVAISIISGM